MVVVDGVECRSCGDQHILHIEPSCTDGNAIGQSWFRFVCPMTKSITEGRMGAPSRVEGGRTSSIFVLGERIS